MRSKGLELSDNCGCRGGWTCPECSDKKQSQLKLLAGTVLKAHKTHLNLYADCQCQACELAREIMGGSE